MNFAKFLTNLLWKIWKINFDFARKIKLGSSSEEYAVASIFLSTIFFSVAFACILFFLRIESKYSLDIKIISLVIFLIISATQILYFFNQKKRFLLLSDSKFTFASYILFIVIWLLLLIALGISMIYQYFEGNFSLFLKYIKDNY